MLTVILTIALLVGIDPSSDAWDVRTIDDQPIALASGDTKATVFIFVSDVCPIANAYQPRVRELQQEFEKQGVQFVEVYPLPSITKQTVVAHRREFNITASAVLDTDRSLAKKLGAKVTPEAIVLNRDGQTLYRGRIDDQHAALGKKRPEPGEHDLANALKAIASGQPVPVSETKAVGCLIRY